MDLPGLKLSQSEVSQEFDLNEILGFDVSDDEGLQESVGQFIIDRIVQRTQSGKGVGGKGFAPYSESYKNSLVFKAFGKTSKVNMTLTEDMLSNLTITSKKGGKIKIGWNDETNNSKAYGHMTGMKDHPWLEGKTPARQFFGFTAAEIKEIKDNFKPVKNSRALENDESILKKIGKLLVA